MARCDAQINALAAALRCLHWFNPLVHFAASRFRFDQELACNASVISRFPEARRPYADAMLKTQLADLGLPAGCHWQSSHPLKERIAMLKQPLPGRKRRRLGGAGVVAIIVAASFAAWAAQPVQSTVENAGAPASKRIHADVVLSFDGAPLDASWTSQSVTGYLMRHDPKRAPSDWEFGLIAGHPFSLEIRRGDESWRIDGTTRSAANHTFEIESTLTHNGSVVSHPKFIAGNNEPTSIKIGEKKNGKFTGFGAQMTFRDGGEPTTSPIPDDEASTAAIQPATYKNLRPPKYPIDAIDRHMQGVAYVKARIRTDGSVAGAHADRVVPASATLLGAAAVEAIKTWRFNPAMRDGTAVEGKVLVPMQFALVADARNPSNLPKIDRPKGALDTILVLASRHGH